MLLEREHRFFDRHQLRWMAEGHSGQWAVIHGDELTGFYPSPRAGLLVGFRRWAPDLFLLKEVCAGADPILDDGLLAGALFAAS